MISVIIPTFQEQGHVKPTIEWLLRHDAEGLIEEIIVADGGSTDNTASESGKAGAKVIISPKKGRAAQMNYGASFATGDVLYFLHADTIPPENFLQDIVAARQKGYIAGCYMLSFDYNHWFLKANCWFTRFNINAVRFGDQSLFIQKEKFEEIGGFCEKHIVLEDQEIINRIKKKGRFAVIRKPVLTSARKYLENGIYKTQGIFFVIYFMYKLGYSQQQLLATYRSLIRQDKL